MTLLSGPLVGGEPPTRVAGKLALTVAVGGFFVAVFAALAVLASRGLVTTETDLRLLAGGLDQGGALNDVGTFYVTMIARFGETRWRTPGCWKFSTLASQRCCAESSSCCVDSRSPRS